MALEHGLRPLARHVPCPRHDRIPFPRRNFTGRTCRQQEATTESATAAPPPPPPTTRRLHPNRVSTPRSEGRLIRLQNQYPIGSRRRRAALQDSSRIPFQQLPYQCFQEARKIILEDRAEKLEEIQQQRKKMDKIRAAVQEGRVPPEDEARVETQLKSMRHRMQGLKIMADVNDPLVKKKFEDGEGDLNKPIYRYLLDLKWRSYKRKVLMQRITQMNVVPDVLPAVDPTVSTNLRFGYKKIPHGDIVESSLTERAPNMTIQPYDQGERLVTIAVINADVPDVSKDGFNYRCHFLASNIKISPTETSVDFGELDEETQVVLPWLPPYAQKGLPYQRMSIFILEQPSASEDPSSPTRSITLPVAEIKAAGRYTKREGFILRSYETKYRLKAVGVDLFRTEWDEGTAGVMQRAGIIGWDVEFKRKRVEPLPYKRLKGERFR